jgi:hypothetical protein
MRSNRPHRHDKKKKKRKPRLIPKESAGLRKLEIREKWTNCNQLCAINGAINSWGSGLFKKQTKKNCSCWPNLNPISIFLREILEDNINPFSFVGVQLGTSCSLSLKFVFHGEEFEGWATEKTPPKKTVRTVCGGATFRWILRWTRRCTEAYDTRRNS